MDNLNDIEIMERSYDTENFVYPRAFRGRWYQGERELKIIVHPEYSIRITDIGSESTD